MFQSYVGWSGCGGATNKADRSYNSQMGRLVDVDTMEAALKELGANPNMLSPDDQMQLKQDGFLLIPGVLEEKTCERLRNRMEEIWQAEGEDAGLEVHQQPGTRRLADLVNKGEVFDAVWLNPLVLTAAWFLIGHPFKLFSLNARDALPGQGEQSLHADWGPRAVEEPCRVVNSIWMLDEFSEASGATRIVPGSHRLAGQPSDYLTDPAAAHPSQRLALGEAGTVMIYNAHAWHGGTRNHSQARRRGLHCAYVDRAFPQQTEQRKYLRDETRERLSPSARFVLDVD